MEWKESEHPRDDAGRFTDTSGSRAREEAEQVFNTATVTDINNSNAPSSEMRRAVPAQMKKALVDAKATHRPEDRWRVDDTYTEDDYSHAKLWVSKGGSTVAVKNGDIISVCKRNGDSISGSDLLRHAIANGGDRLDAFGKSLYAFYLKNGFEPVSWTEFDVEYAPYDWNKDTCVEEPVIFYRYTGKKNMIPYEEFISNTKPSTDYDEARKARDGRMKK